MTGLVFIWGLIFGSFLNVVIYRLQRGERLSYPASHCPVCGVPVRSYDNIPLVSYLILKGRCRHCREKISPRYPFVEFLTGAVFMLLYLRFGFTIEFGKYSLLLLFLIPISFIDWDTKLVLNKLTIPGFFLGIFYMVLFQIEIWQRTLLGALAGGLLLLLLAFLGKVVFKKESIGFGDVKLLVLIGVYVGFPNVLICFLLSMICASVYIIAGMAVKKIHLGDTIPFGPFLAIGTLGYLLTGEELVQWYTGLYGL